MYLAVTIDEKTSIEKYYKAGFALCHYKKGQGVIPAYKTCKKQWLKYPCWLEALVFWSGRKELTCYVRRKLTSKNSRPTETVLGQNLLLVEVRFQQKRVPWKSPEDGVWRQKSALKRGWVSCPVRESNHCVTRWLDHTIQQFVDQEQLLIDLVTFE